MIIPLKESRGRAFGFRVEGKLTAEDVNQLGIRVSETIAAKDRKSVV